MALFGKVELLLIEDDTAVYDLIYRILTASAPTNWPLTYRIQRAISMREALKYASGGYWDIIILDLSLPDSQGIDTFKQIKAVAKAPIFVFTGTASYEEIEELFSLGAVRVYAKTEIMGCLSIMHRIIDNCMREKGRNDKLYQLEQSRLNVIRSLEVACAECGKWKLPDTDEWVTPEKFLEHYKIYLSHGFCPEDMKKRYGDLSTD